MFKLFKRKRTKRISGERRRTRSTHFIGKIYNRHLNLSAKRCGTKKSGLLMELNCPNFTVSVRAEHIEGFDYIRIHRIGNSVDGVSVSELVNVIGDEREPKVTAGVLTVPTGQFHSDVGLATTYIVGAYGGSCGYRDWETDRKSTRLNSSHRSLSRMPSSA